MKSYNFHNKFLLRTPLRPLREDFSAEHIHSLVQSPQIQEALFLASPVLYEQTKKWLEQGLSKNKEEKLLDSLYKYLVRMHNRCTPFGLFAGCITGEWDEKTNINLNHSAHISRITRLDMNYLCALAQYLEKQAGISEHLKYFPNSSIHTKGTALHYLEYFYQKNKRKHRVNTVDYDDFLNLILKKSRPGCTIPELAAALSEFDEEIQKEEAAAYVKLVIDAQILVSELEPAITGKGLLLQIIQVLEPISQQSKDVNVLLQRLLTIDSALKTLDHNIQNCNTAYIRIINEIEKIGVPYEVSKLFQTDFYKTGNSIKIDRKIQHQLSKCMNFLYKISDCRESKKLLNFIDAFYNRYEDREMPLLDVLDTQWGIGYPVNSSSGDVDPLTRDIILPKKTAAKKIKWNDYEKFIFTTILKNKDKAQIDLSTEDLGSIEPDKDYSLADSIYCIFKLLGDNKILFNFAGESSGTKLITRFAHVDKDTRQIIDDLVKHEESCIGDDTIIAEVIHLPEARTGNILLHPDVRGFEIPYLGKSSKNKDSQIPLGDIFISVNPVSKDINLRSKSLNKRILPRLSNAHNYSYKGLPVYQFLCDMALHKKAVGLMFDKGALYKNLKQIPRIVWKDIVLSPASWYLEKKSYHGISAHQIHQFRAAHNIPQKVVLLQGDNKLLFDLNNPLAARVFLKEINKLNSIELAEFLMPDNNVKDNKNNAYANEIIAFLKRADVQVQKQKFKHTSENYPNNLFLGSQWLYYKIYTGISCSDRIISEILSPAANYFLDKGWIDKWFFIRYSDPDHHIRFRVKITDLKFTNAIIQYLFNQLKTLTEQDIIYKIQTDTYKPEIDRYGTQTIGYSEEWFMHDSQTTAHILSLIGEEQGKPLRWLYATRAIDELLNNFGYTTDKKKALLTLLKDAFAKEFHSNKFLRKQITAKYRTHKKAIFQILDRSKDSESSFAPLFNILKQQTIRATPCIDQILLNPEIPLDKLLASYIHMLINRLFRTEQRKMEMVIYDFMHRYYTTKSILLISEVPQKKLDYEISQL